MAVADSFMALTGKLKARQHRIIRSQISRQYPINIPPLISANFSIAIQLSAHSKALHHAIKAGLILLRRLAEPAFA